VIKEGTLVALNTWLTSSGDFLCKIKDGKMVIDVVGANGKDKKQHQFDVKF
jgi:hypothetical protein